MVASDGSTDGTAGTVASFAERGVRLLELPRAGKVSAQNAAVGETDADVVAFSDANSLWEPDALACSSAASRMPMGYVCGRVDVNGAGRATAASLYWR